MIAIPKINQLNYLEHSIRRTSYLYLLTRWLMRPMVSIRILVVLPEEVEKFNFCLSQWQNHYKHGLVWLKETKCCQWWTLSFKKCFALLNCIKVQVTSASSLAVSSFLLDKCGYTSWEHFKVGDSKSTKNIKAKIKQSKFFSNLHN